MIVRINWAEPKDMTPTYHPTYSVWQCQKYFVQITGWSGGSIEPSRPSSAMIYLDEGTHEIGIGPGDVAYFMNDEGKTFDTLRT